jgi:hypothetical protein
MNLWDLTTARPVMTSKTKQSGRVDILVRMAPELKSRVIEAANEVGMSMNDLVLAAIEQMLAIRDAEPAAGKSKADIEHRLDMKFQEIVASLACEARLGDLTSLSAERLIDLHDEAEAEIEEWRDHAASDHHAEPRTPIERLCKDHQDIEMEIERGPDDVQQSINAVDDDDFDLDEPDEPASE